MKFSVLTTVLICLFSHLFSQQEWIRFELIGQEKGLPDNSAWGITQDDQGLIWVSTQLGLARYDGYQVERFPFKAPSPIFQKNRPLNVRAITKGPDGDLWLGTFLGEVYRFDIESLSFVPYFQPDSSGNTQRSTIRKLLVDDQLKVWLALGNNGLAYVEVTERSLSWKATKESKWHNFSNRSGNFPAQQVWDIALDPEGSLWATSEKGVLKWNENKGNFRLFPFPDSMAGALSRSIHISSDGIIWVGIDKVGLFQLNTENGQYIPYPLGVDFSQSEINRIFVDSKKTLWLFDRIEFHDYVVQKKSSEGRAVRKKVHLSGDYGQRSSYSLQQIFEDTTGLIWVAGHRAGLLKYLEEGNQFEWLQDRSGRLAVLENISVAHLFQDSSRNVWMATFGHGLYCWNYSTGALTHFDLNKEKRASGFLDNLLAVTEGKQGGIWMASGSDGVGLLNPSNSYFQLQNDNPDFPKELKNRSCNYIISDRVGGFWIATMPGWLQYYNPQTREHKTYRGLTAEGERNNRPYYDIDELFQDSEGKIWVGTNTFGFYRFDPVTEKAIHFDFPPGGDFWEDQKKRVWISTYGGGLIGIDVQTLSVQQFSRSHGLPHNKIRPVLSDQKGHLWIGANYGLVHFDPDRGAIQSFFMKDGLPSDEFRSRCRLVLETGEMIFKTAKGLVLFHPDKFTLDSTKAHVALMEIMVNNQALETIKGDSSLRNAGHLKKITLNHYENDLSIRYTATNFKNPERNHYQLKLENFDNNWRNVGNNNRVTYTNLDPGHYTFKVKAANRHGLWNEIPSTLDIIIHPPWYWNIWSWSIYLLVIGLLSYWFYNFQLNRRLALAEAKRLNDLNDLKTRLYTNITHEFRTPLTVIKGMTEQISGHSQEKKLIQRNSKQLLDLVNQLLELTKHEAGQLELDYIQADILPFLRYITESFHSYAINEKINLNFYADTESIIMDFDREKILRILSNLISNALKFTPEYGKVLITAKSKQKQLAKKQLLEYLEIQIKDTGIGIAPDQLPHIFERFYQADASPTRRAEGTGIGLTLTKRLIDDMEGSISVSSQKGEGSIFTIQLPITNQAPVEEVLRQESWKPSDPQATSTEKEVLPLAPSVSQDHDLPLLLLVEDNSDVMHYLTSCLKGSFQLIYAKNGRSGIQQALERIPDIIISDIMMPEVDGLELCNRLKTDQRTSHIPIILLTAKADQDSLVEGLQKGADAYLAKPFDKKELLVRLNKLIELRKNLQSRYQKFGVIPIKKDLNFQQEDDFLEKVKNVIEKNLDNELFDVQQLYRAVGVSRIQLYRKLKALTSQSPGQIIQQIRLYHARALLNGTNMTVGEVASRTGFKDASYFTKKYKEVFEELPSETNKIKGNK